jgi:hypothetical protein
MRRRAWCAGALLAVGALAPAGAQAAPPEPELVIEGRHSAVTEIVLTEHLQAYMDATVTGGDQYAGALIEPLEPGPGPYFLVLRLGHMPTAVIPANGGQFPPGRYRVRLFADAPARITLHLEQQDAGRTVRPRAPLAVTTRSGGLPLAAGRSDAELRLRGAVPPQHGSVLLMTVRGARLEQTYACATTTRSCPSTLAEPPAPVPDADPGLRPPSAGGGYSVSYLRGRPQRQDALFGVDGVRAEDGAIRAGVLTFSP